MLGVYQVCAPSILVEALHPKAVAGKIPPRQEKNIRRIASPQSLPENFLDFPMPMHLRWLVPYRWSRTPPESALEMRIATQQLRRNIPV